MSIAIKTVRAAAGPISEVKLKSLVVGWNQIGGRGTPMSRAGGLVVHPESLILQVNDLPCCRRCVRLRTAR